MINVRKTVAVYAGAVGIAAGAAIFAPATASAATYGGQCGAGFRVIDTHDLDLGTIFLAYNGEQNCVVTVRNKRGGAKEMGAGLELSDGRKNVTIDFGNYTEFAGPVFLRAAGKCIDWAGSIDNDTWQEFKVHCG